MKNDPIRIGVIGCGEIAQLMHLPFLRELPDFTLTALCDLSPTRLNGVAEKFGVAARYLDHRELLADANIDAVAVCTFDHGAIVADAIAAGKHVLVEKPLAFTSEEAMSLVAAAEAKKLVAMVGYMKRYDRAFERASERLARMGRPRAVQVHNFAGRFDRYGKLYTQINASDVPRETIERGKADVEQRIIASLGPGYARYAGLYLHLLMLGSHDLSVLRGLFGTPERVAYARAVSGQQILAILDLPDGIPCILEIGIGAAYEWWDEWVSVHGESEELCPEFSHPYIRNAPSVLRIREADRESPAERIIPVSNEEPFRLQWQHFAACVRGEVAPRTPLRDGLADVRLTADMIRALPPG